MERLRDEEEALLQYDASKIDFTGSRYSSSKQDKIRAYYQKQLDRLNPDKSMQVPVAPLPRAVILHCFPVAWFEFADFVLLVNPKLR